MQKQRVPALPKAFCTTWRHEIDVECNFKIVSRNGFKVLSDVLPRIGVVVSVELRENSRDLVRRKLLAAAKSHVLLGVSHAGKTNWCLIAAHKIVSLSTVTTGDSLLDIITTRKPLPS